MPEPFNKKISLDNFIYTSFKEMKVPKICMLNPNLITIFNLFGKNLPKQVMTQINKKYLGII